MPLALRVAYGICCPGDFRVLMGNPRGRCSIPPGCSGPGVV
jgi:hypothetical protein